MNVTLFGNRFFVDLSYNEVVRVSSSVALGWIRREEKSCGTRDPWGGGNSVKMEGDGSLVTRAKEPVGLPETGRGSKAPPPEAVDTHDLTTLT